MGSVHSWDFSNFELLSLPLSFVSHAKDAIDAVTWHQ